MEKLQLTDEQKNAINYDGDLLISASAGSGKTFVLTKKVLKLIDRGIKLDSVLMLTFTLQAAEEMKIRLERDIKELLYDGSGTKALENALNDISNCDISTIDGFCQKLVKKFYYKLNIEPSFEILDPSYSFYLKNTVLDKIISNYIKSGDEDFENLLNTFIENHNFNNFKHQVFSYYEFLTSKQDRLKWNREVIEKTYNKNINENLAISIFKNNVKLKVEHYLETLKGILNKAKATNNEKLVDLTEKCNSVLSLNFENNERFLVSVLSLAEFPIISFGRKKLEPEENFVKEELQTFRALASGYLSKIKSYISFSNLEELKREILRNKKYAEKFCEIIEKFDFEYLKIKRERNSYDFYDMEDLALSLLNDADVLNYVNEKYKYVFVDEYQDTNDIQESLLNKISKNSKEVMVGDVKQSIYAFRQCNPQIFLDKINKNEIEVINLNENFRSHKDILEFSNIIFSNLMRKENMNLSYKDNPFKSPEKKKKYAKNSLKRATVITLIRDKTKKEKVLEEVDESETKQEVKEDKLSAGDKENMLVFNAISNLLKQKIYDEKIKDFRNLKFSDIAILTRNRTSGFNSLVEFLSLNNIPISVKYKEKIFQSFEVNLILNYLKILNDLNLEIELVSVLKNIYQISLNDIYKLKQKGSLGQELLNSNLEIFERFKKDYAYFKNLSYEVNVKQLIYEIIEECVLENLFLKLFGKVSLERVRVFIESFVSSKLNLFEFLTNLKNIDTNLDVEISKTSGENSIKIETFHASKGLEYNAVIVIGAGAPISKSESDIVLKHSDFGMGIYNFDGEEKLKKRSFIYNILAEENNRKSFLEETRILYVALTRAKEFLVVVGSEANKNLQPCSSYVDFEDLHSYLSLIFSANIYKKEFDIVKVSIDDEILLDLSYESNNDCDLKLNFEEFDKIFNFKYPYFNSTQVQLKNSVTSLTEENNYNISNFKITDITEDDEDFLLIGNAYHKAFELLPFNLQSSLEVKNLLENYVESGKMNANLLNEVNFDSVYNENKIVSDFVNINSKIFKEQKFIMKIPLNNVLKKSSVSDKILVQGTIDLFIQNENENILIDYKTSRIKKEEDFIKKYKTQLDLYEMAIKASNLYNNKPIKKFIYSVYLNCLINVR